MSTAIDEYLQSATKENYELLQHIRQLVHQQVADLEEVISYGMPGFRQKTSGKIVIGFAINKRSLSVYPHSGSTLDNMKSDLAPFRSALSALQFSPEKPLPDTIIKELITVRLQEIKNGYGKK